jgi:predicted nucleotidyltransferase
MDYLQHDIPDYKKQFFNRLSEYLNTKIYYYGSVQRYDNFNESDIDIDIFTTNENETLNKICHFLNFNIEKVKKIIWKLHNNGENVYGYKLLYFDSKNDFYVDISIINEKYKDDVLNDQLTGINISFFYVILYIVLKFIYYKLQLIDWATYSYLHLFSFKTPIYFK